MIYQQTIKHDFDNNLRLHNLDNTSLKTLEKNANNIYHQAEQIFHKGILTQLKKKSRDLFEQYASDPLELEKQLQSSQDKLQQSIVNLDLKLDFKNHAQQINFSLINKAKIDYQKSLNAMKKNITGQEIQENLNLIGILYENAFQDHSSKESWNIIQKTQQTIGNLKNEVFDNGLPLFNPQQKAKVDTTVENIKLQALKNVFNQALPEEKFKIYHLLSSDKWEAYDHNQQPMNVKTLLEGKNYHKLKSYCAQVLKKFKTSKKNKPLIDDELILNEAVDETFTEENLLNQFNRIMNKSTPEKNKNHQELLDLRYQLHQAWENQKIQTPFYENLIEKTTPLMYQEEKKYPSHWNFLMRGVQQKNLSKEHLPFVKDFLYQSCIQHELSPSQGFSSKSLPKVQNVLNDLNFVISFLTDNNSYEVFNETN